MAEWPLRRPRRLAGSAPVDCGDGRGGALRAALRRRHPPLPFLHFEPSRAELRDLSPARRKGKAMTASESFRAEAAKRILIKDGAYGTLVQAQKLQSGDYCGGLDLGKDQRGNNDLLNLTKPELIRSICESFADADADVLATNTFNANAISQADFDAEHLVGDMNRASARIVREVADRYSAKDGKPRWVAGAIGP